MSYGPMTTEHLTVPRSVLTKYLPEDEVKAVEDWIKQEDDGCIIGDTLDFLNTEEPSHEMTDEEREYHARCRALIRKFKEATGLDIELTWTDECESCYDTAEEGLNWEFVWSSVWQKTPAALALEKELGEPLSVTFSTVHG